jgi:hypothetical protein
LRPVYSATPSRRTETCEENPSSEKQYAVNIVGNPFRSVLSSTPTSPRPPKPLHIPVSLLFLFPFLEHGHGKKTCGTEGSDLAGPARGPETPCSLHLPPRFLSFSAIPKRGGIGVACTIVYFLLLAGRRLLTLSFLRSKADATIWVHG